jgi:hypothetical protein
MFLAAIFAVVCLGVSGHGFWSLDAIADPEQRADARGFAWFWTFLALVAVAFGTLSWRIVRSRDEDGGA